MSVKIVQSRKSLKELSKFGASYDAGLTIEADPNSCPPKLAIDGKRIPIKKEDRRFSYSEEPNSLNRPTLSSLAKRIVDISWHRKKREKIRQKHLAELRKGRESWNRWRKEHPEIRPLLFGASLQDENLTAFDFCNANLIEANLRGATLIDANFHEANLGKAQLICAKLMGANFCRTDLFETNLYRANLTGANLQGTQLARTNFERAKLIGCTIYGLSAWDLKLEGACQKDLRILYKVESENGKWSEGEFIVDDLEVAQFVYLVLNNQRISKVI